MIRTMATSDEVFDAIVHMAIEAGAQIMTIYRSEFAVTHKDDQSPLTQADLAAHQHIMTALQSLTPDIPILSEEAADIPYPTRAHWSRYWLVDPLDGTKEFIKRNDEFTVNIALIEHGTAVMSVVHAPALVRTYAAGVGRGALRWHDGKRDAIHTRRVPDTPPIYLVSKSHRNAALEALLARAPVHESRGIGSSLKFCAIAEGAADLHPRTGPTSEWDTAAGQCIVEQAGGQVLRTSDLQPLRYNQKDSLLNPDFLVIGDPDYGWPSKLDAGARGAQ